MKNGFLSFIGKNLEADARRVADEKKTLFGVVKLPEALKIKEKK